MSTFGRPGVLPTYMRGARGVHTDLSPARTRRRGVHTDSDTAHHLYTISSVSRAHTGRGRLDRAGAHGTAMRSPHKGPQVPSPSEWGYQEVPPLLSHFGLLPQPRLSTTFQKNHQSLGFTTPRGEAFRPRSPPCSPRCRRSVLEIQPSEARVKRGAVAQPNHHARKQKRGGFGRFGAAPSQPVEGDPCEASGSSLCAR